MDNFSLKKWMFENKVTKQSALINEVEVDLGGPNDARSQIRCW